MRTVAFTGSRNLTKEQELKIYRYFKICGVPDGNWLVGDCPTGVDFFMRRAANYYQKNLEVIHRTGDERYQFAERSKLMVKILRSYPNPILYGFVKDLCPPEIFPGSGTWNGNGTWGTISFAKKCGLPISLHWIGDSHQKNWFPNWMLETQLSLF